MQLRRLITHAYNYVPYYQSLFEQNGIKPDDIRTVENISAVPITSKADLRSSPLNGILSRGANPRRLVKRMTSGSSGMPFTIFRSSFEDHLINLFRIQARRDCGLRISDRIAIISETPLVKQNQKFLSRCKEALGIYRTSLIDCFQTDRDIIAELERIRPNVIVGYPSTLEHIAPLLCKESRIPVSPRFVITGGGVMSSVTRRGIEEGFNSPVFDFYGAHEFNLLAWECPEHGAYHICENNVILEIVRDGRPVSSGETGEVIATGLHTFTMPFIRYRTGDIATKGKNTCPSCGQPVSTINQIQGRTIEYFHLAGGVVIHPYVITGPLIKNDSSWICQHQLVQETRNHVILRIKPLGVPGQEELDRLQRLGQEKVGPDNRFSIELKKGFPREAGKKFRPYISKIASSHDKNAQGGNKK